MKQIKAWDTKGNLTADQTILDPRTGIVTPQGYSASAVAGEVGAVTDGANVNFIFTSSEIPLRGSVRIDLDGVPTVYATDDFNGVLAGPGVSGTVDYSTGLIDITFAVAHAGGSDILISYTQNYEASTDIPQIQSYYDSVLVEAKPYALKATMGMFEAFDLKKRFNFDQNEEIAKDLVSEINAELGGELIRLMAAAAVGNTPFTLNPLPAGVSWNEHKQQLIDKIFADAAAVISSNAGRGIVSLIIAGNAAANTLSTLPGFEQLTDGNSIGAHVYGTLRGAPIVKVPEAAVLASNVIIVAYKGTSPFEAPGVYAPYMPLVTTDLLPMSPNPLMKQRAGAVMAAVKVLVSSFITKITLTY
jgi:hypothetical protein